MHFASYIIRKVLPGKESIEEFLNEHLGSVVTIPDFAMRYVSRYLGHDAIRIAILVYCVSQCLDLQFVYDGNAIYRPRYTLPNHHNRCRMCWSLAVA